VLVETLKDDVANDFLQKAADIADQLSIDREPAFYGSEDSPAEELFDREDTEEILRNAEFVINYVVER
jgi:HEPN domain-containing protein